MAGAVQPSRSDVHVNRILTNMSLGYMQDATAFVADRAFPVIPVEKMSDRYFSYDKSYWFRNEMRERAPASESAGANYAIDNTPSYSARPWSLHRDIDDQVRANADNPISLDREATMFLSLKALISKEVNWAAKYFTTGIWGTDIAGVVGPPVGNQVYFWSDYANSNPVEDIRLYKQVVQGRTGSRPNKLILGRQVFDELLDHPDIIGRFDRGQTTGVAVATKQTLAALFELDEVLVMDSIQATAAEAAATQTYAFIGGKQALLVYAAPAPGILTPSGGYTFSWTGLYGSNALAGRISNFRMEAIRSDRIEIDLAYDQKLVAADLGVFFTTIVA